MTRRVSGVRFHAVPVSVMRAQADAIDLPTSLYPTTPQSFEAAVLSALATLRVDGIGGLIFGNIHLADVRAWYEERVRAAGLAHIEPLWGEAPGRLVREVLARGYTAVLACIDAEKAEPSWLGQPLTEDIVVACEQRGIDPGGEYGEYHTLVTDGPLFGKPLPVRFGMVHVATSGVPQMPDRFRQLDVQLAVQ